MPCLLSLVVANKAVGTRLVAVLVVEHLNFSCSKRHLTFQHLTEVGMSLDIVLKPSNGRFNQIEYDLS